MRLGLVMMGTFAQAASCVGVLRALDARGIEPHAVCGMGAGAWAAALFAAGMSPADMETALHQAAGVGGRMIAPCMWFGRMPAGNRMNRLLNAQTGQRILSLCPRAALFPCRMAKDGRRVAFSTRAFVPEGEALLTMQATVGFAARAAMAAPPLLAPMPYMGTALLAEDDAAYAVRQLLHMGAHRVLVICPQASPRRAMQAADLLGAPMQWTREAILGEQAGLLRIELPESAGALSFDQLGACSEAGYRIAQQELDAVFERMGMAYCRVLPFRRQMG